jgi:hypothetical protein
VSEERSWLFRSGKTRLSLVLGLLMLTFGFLTACTSLVIEMLVAVYVHLQPGVPPEVLPTRYQASGDPSLCPLPWWDGRHSGLEGQSDGASPDFLIKIGRYSRHNRNACPWSRCCEEEAAEQITRRLPHVAKGLPVGNVLSSDRNF